MDGYTNQYQFNKVIVMINKKEKRNQQNITKNM